MKNNNWNKPIPYESMPKNPKEDVYDFSPMNDFTKKNLYLYRRVIRWMEYGLFSVIVQMDKEETYYYNNAENLLMPIKLFNSTLELTESEWQNGFAYFLGRKIRFSKMNKNEIAKSAGISTVQLSRYLHMKAVPSGHIIQRLADALECDANDILPHDFIPIR